MMSPTDEIDEVTTTESSSVEVPEVNGDNEAKVANVEQPSKNPETADDTADAEVREANGQAQISQTPTDQEGTNVMQNNILSYNPLGRL